MENEALEMKKRSPNKSNSSKNGNKGGKCKLIVIVILAILLIVFIIALIAAAVADARTKEKQKKEIEDLSAKQAENKNTRSSADASMEAMKMREQISKANAAMESSNYKIALDKLKMENARLNETLKNKTSALNKLKMDNTRLNETLKNKTSDANKEATKLREQITKDNATIKSLNDKIASLPCTNPCSGRTLKHLGTVNGTAINRTVTMNGDWIVFQRRQDGSVNFARKWTEYVNGFGNPCGEYWLGLETIYQLTKNGDHKLRIDMINRGNGNSYWAEYSTFKLSNSADKYRLTVSGYSGNATDVLNFRNPGFASNGNRFTTIDADNDGLSSTNCALQSGGGWWHRGCSYARLNGNYNIKAWNGILWVRNGGHVKPRFVEMKIKKRN